MRLTALTVSPSLPAAPVPKMKNKHPDAELLVGIWEAVAPGKGGQMWGRATWTIDDKLGLTEREKLATVYDLLLARSGVYHPSGFESPNMIAAREARGSHGPGINGMGFEGMVDEIQWSVSGGI